MAEQKKLYVIRTRQLGIRDLVFALRPRRKSYSSLELLEQAGLVRDLKPEWEHRFVQDLVETHPTYKRDFEHALIDPPKGILPSQVYQEIHARSDMVPTLYIVQMQNGHPVTINKVNTYYELLSLVSDARDDGLIPEKGAAHDQ